MGEPAGFLQGTDHVVAGVAIMLAVLTGQPAWAAGEFSPSFLGMYRKTIAIEQQLFVQAARYGIDPRLARALIMQESGGNANLVSTAGARGYFQVLPEHFQQLGVSDNANVSDDLDDTVANIEAGIKRLSQLQQELEREDYVIAAYQNASSVESEGEPQQLGLASLQYVMQVRHYKLILCLHEAEVRRQAEPLRLLAVEQGDSWSSLAQLAHTSEAVLRLYNPMLAPYQPQVGMVVTYPALQSQAGSLAQAGTQEISQEGQGSLVEVHGATVSYTSRIGDSALNLAQVFGGDLEAFRQEHQLWQLQQLPVGIQFTVQLSPPSRAAPQSKKPQPVYDPALVPIRSRMRTYTVEQGDTLVQIAHRHGISVQALMRANRLDTSHLQIGDALRIPGLI